MTKEIRPPFVVRPSFWLISGALGWLTTLTWTGAILTMAVLFISVCVHELGHAAAYLAFGKRVSIELNGFGGQTSIADAKRTDRVLPTWQQLLVELAGPTAGMLLAGLAFLVAQTWPQDPSTPLGFALQALWMWTVVLSLLNLLPILPLDGGQIVRSLLTGAFGQRAIRWAFLSSCIVAVLLAVGALVFMGNLIGAAILALLAVQNGVAWSSAKNLVEQDLMEPMRELFEEALEHLANKRYDEAERLLVQVCQEAPGGLLDVAAHEQLAELEQRRGRYQQAYDLLDPLLAQLSPEAKMLYHELALTLKKYDRVIEIGDGCFRELPDESVALRNSLAYAALGKAPEAMHWFEAAWENGLPNAPALLVRHEFDPIKQSAEYRHVFESLDRRKQPRPAEDGEGAS
jgi:stage IV sporulation protein FB